MRLEARRYLINPENISKSEWFIGQLCNLLMRQKCLKELKCLYWHSMEVSEYVKIVTVGFVLSLMLLTS